MEITVTQVEGSIIQIGLDGRLDVTTLKSLRGRVETLLQEGQRRLIVDCARLEFVSSAGIGSLVILHRSVTEMEGTIRFAGANGAVLDVLELMNLGSILNLSPDVEHARQALGPAQPGPSS